MPYTNDAMNQEKDKKAPGVLMILDGFGLANPKEKGNAITPKTAPHIFQLMNEYPHSKLKAHGKAVGLFPNQSGNSEAGHFNIGAGRVVKQDLLMISEAIKDGTFYKNTAFQQALEHTKKYKSAVHVMGLLTDGQSAHTHPDHLYAMLEYLRRKKVKQVYIHLFTDGRDSSPHSALTFLNDLRMYMKNGEKIASVMGRFYAMDRDKQWERTEKAYNTLVLGKGEKAASAEEAMTQAYNRDETDEYVSPTIITDKKKPVGLIQENDTIFFFNARSDRARQLTKAFVQKDFLAKNTGAFKRKKFPKNICFVAMTDFGPDLDSIFTAFPSPDIHNSLAKAVGESRKQLYISETEKYAHMTFFLNGGFPEPINGEKRELVQSTGHHSYKDYPQMSCKKIANIIIKYIKNEAYDFIVVNFPNADMVGHTGDFKATKKAVKIMDKQVQRIVSEVQKKNGFVLITGDHGNAEQMLNTKTGEVMTEHTTNPVPCIIVSEDLKKVKLRSGKLADVAPTLLKIMGLKKPSDMTGRALY